eukprot:14701689-Alexandrium_andersonii.AAC.1
MPCVANAARMRDAPARFCEHTCVASLRPHFARLRLRLFDLLSSRHPTLQSCCSWADPEYA